MTSPLPTVADVPPAPRVPSERARRLVFRYQGSQKALLVVGVVFAAIGSLVSVPLCWSVPTDLALDAGAVVRDAVVLAADLDYSIRVNGQHPTAIEFAFVADGVERRGRSLTRDAALIERARPGATVQVETSELSPDYFRLAGTQRNLVGYWGLLALLFPALGMTLAGRAVRSNRREIRAFTFGRPVIARVTYAGADRRVRVNGRHPFKVAWEFRVGDDVYEGSISSMKMLEIEDLMQAQELAVVYDPGNPRVNTVYIP